MRFLGKHLLKSLMGLWQAPFFVIGWLAWIAWDSAKLGAWVCEEWVGDEIEELKERRE